LQEPKFETVTRETVETYRGNRPDRVTTSEKRDVFQNLPDEFRGALLKDQNGNCVLRNVVSVTFVRCKYFVANIDTI